MFIDCAIAAKAKYIVSGDNDLLCLKETDNIEIITPKIFLEILKNKSAGKGKIRALEHNSRHTTPL